MRLEVMPFKIEHLADLAEQEATAYLRPFVREDALRALEGTPRAFTGRWDGRTVVVAGLVEHWKDRAEAFAFLSPMGAAALTAVHRAVKRFLGIQPYPRVEAVVDCDFHNGHQWVRMLGFRMEAERMRGFLPTGGDAALYALVR